ncbi:hypothetical protein, partial [Chryseobacterium taichungense]|uniref:hypothetical protein n=1 Tax=Chryseobacterium taichungense TaxID=295069 RepID=UPI0028A82631
VATAVSPTGDVAISNAGITSIGTGKVTTAHLANNAVTVAKLPTGATATTFLRGDGTWVTPTDTNTTYTAGTGLTLTGTSFSANDATTTTKGIIQLAGDLAGPVAAPTIASGAVTSAKIADGTIANGDLNTGVGGIYKGSGALSGGNTSVDLGTNNLSFTSGASTGTSHFTVDGTTLNVDAVNNRVGIGTSTPGNLLEISSSSSNTGLKLPYGAAAGKILTSDAAGNSSWQTNNAVFIYSEVHATGSSQSFTTGNKVTFFHNIKGENIKAIYGNSYGWIDATQRWIAPYTGKYRVTTNMYFNNSSGTNPRLYAYLNGSTTCNITSATNNGSTDGTAYTSAIVSLNQNDYIEWKIPPGCTCFNATLFGADYYTFIRVESVE